MRRSILTHRWQRELLLAAATLPLFATTCAQRSVDFLLGSGVLDTVFDNRSNADKAEDILDDIDDLFDSVF